MWRTVQTGNHLPGQKILLHRNRTSLQKHEKVFLEKVLHVLKTGENEVHVTDETREKQKPLERMLELAK